MQRPFVIAGRLNEKYRSEQNQYMARKLETAKPLVNMKCPESFHFYKTSFKRPKIWMNNCKFNLYNIFIFNL